PPARNRAAFPYGWIFTLNLVGLLALVLTDLAATPLLAVAGAVSIVSIVLALLAFVDIAQRIRARRRFQANLPQLLEEVGPVFYLYWHAHLVPLSRSRCGCRTSSASECPLCWWCGPYRTSDSSPPPRITPFCCAVRSQISMP